jgi:3-hydroxybutyryl-CoA dehydrogenase
VILEEGRSAGEIDAAMLSAGYRIGPFSLIDLIGADINLAATRSVSQAMGGHPRYMSSPLRRRPWPRAVWAARPGAASSSPTNPAGPRRRRPDHRADRGRARQRGRLVPRRRGGRAEAIDEAVRLGLSFPRGPFEILAARGAGPLRAVLDALDAGAPGHLKGRYALAPS